MAILLQNAFESALTTFLSRVPLRCGYETDLRGPLLNIKVPFRQNYKSEHQVFYYLQIIRHLGLALNKSSCESQDPDCSIEIPKKIEKEGNRILASMGIGADDPFFCLCPGSVNSEAKRWPAEYFAKLADIISEEMHAKTVFVGSPSEKSFINSIVDKMKYNSGINIAGSSNLAQSMSIMSKSRFVVSNDTGSAHIAVAAGAKILTIFGPTIAGATAPYGPDAHIISGEAPCTPCRHYTCPVPGHPCMSRIDPESVMARVLELI
jgi:heptosyltransferase-2